MATRQSPPDPATRLLKEKTILLTSYRRDGRPVSTPVNVVVEQGHVYFRTYDAAWKVKRMRRNPEVEVAPCTFRGNPTGSPIRARVRQVDGEEARVAAHALARRFPFLHGMIVPWMHKLKRYTTLHFELLPLAPSR